MSKVKDTVPFEDVSKIWFSGVYIPNLYLYDKNLNITRKMLLSMLLYIEKYYGHRVITGAYLANILGLSKTTVGKELKNLEELNYIKSKVKEHKNIVLGKRYYVLIKPESREDE